jgi:hypothetical protein
MRIGGHRVRDHIRLLAPLFGLIAAVWVLRMIVAEAGSPSYIILIVSVTTTTAFSMLLAVLLIHFRRFGGYANVVVASFLLNVWAQILISGAISFAMLTGTENIYTAPAFDLSGGDGSKLSHLYGHLTFEIALGTLEGAAVGCLLLWLLRMLASRASVASETGTHQHER